MKKLFILFLIPFISYAQDTSEHKNLNIETIKTTLQSYLNKETYNAIGMPQQSAQPFLESMIIRAMLYNIEPGDTVAALIKIKSTGIRNFLKSVCYVEGKLWCYLGIQDKNNRSKQVALKDLSQASVGNALELLELLFDRYNENLTNERGDEVKAHFASWDPQLGPIILKLYEGNYINNIQIAQNYRLQLR